MAKRDCSLLCFCSNRNRLDGKEFSNILSGLASLKNDRAEFNKALSAEGIFGYREYYSLEKVQLGFALYLIQSKERFMSAIADLKKTTPEVYNHDAERIKIMSGFATKYPSFSVSLHLRTSEGEFGLTDFSPMPAFINSALSLIGKVKPKEQPVQECVAFVFKKEETKLAGGLSLPMALPLGKELVDRIGEASIDGLELHFQKSPVHLRNAAFSLQKSNLLVRVIALPFVSISAETPRKVYEHTHKLAELFLEKNGKVKQRASVGR